jgi:heavy metal sensor kinase
MRDIAVAIYDRRTGHLTMPDSLPASRAAPRRVIDARAPNFLEILSAAPFDETSFTTVVGQSAGVRVVALPYTLARRELVIGASQSLAGAETMLREARYAMWIGIPLMLVLAAGGGNILARKSLEPVAGMTEQAARIGASSLHERLPVANEADELGRLATVFNDLLGRLDESFEQQRRFMADASHELRTPVAIVSGEAELALSKRDRPVDDLRDALATIRDEGRRLKRIVDELFLLARANAGDQPLAPEHLYLGEMASDCMRAMRTIADQKDITLSYTGDEDLPFFGDEALLRRLVMNLLDNAIKYTPAGGDVEVRAGRENGSYVLAVRDSGPGIPAEAQPHIFDRFYRARRDRVASASATTSAGLGLAIARWVAELHGGTLTLGETSERGTTVVARLPALAPVATPVALPA